MLNIYIENALEVLTMKKLFTILLCLLLAGLCACGSTTPEEIATATTEAVSSTDEIKPNEIKPYAWTLWKYKIRDFVASNPGQHYALADIDGDGMKELLLGTEEWGGEIALTIVYATPNGVAVDQKQFETLGEGGSTLSSLIYKNGTIRTRSVVDEEWLRYYRFEDGELKEQAWLVRGIDSNEGKYYRFFSDDPIKHPLTEEEYERLKMEFEGDGETVELDWKPLAEYKG